MGDGTVDDGALVSRSAGHVLGRFLLLLLYHFLRFLARLRKRLVSRLDLKLVSPVKTFLKPKEKKTSMPVSW
jgi:hypothetical protein